VEGTLIHHELRPENFRRTIELDPSIDADKISAKIEQGLVTLTLPKAEHVKPRKIGVS
jgi:HSP20 family protein